jgi:hypothetical protein
MALPGQFLEMSREFLDRVSHWRACGRFDELVFEVFVDSSPYFVT